MATPKSRPRKRLILTWAVSGAIWCTRQYSSINRFEGEDWFNRWLRCHLLVAASIWVANVQKLGLSSRKRRYSLHISRKHRLISSPEDSSMRAWRRVHWALYCSAMAWINAPLSLKCLYGAAQETPHRCATRRREKPLRPFSSNSWIPAWINRSLEMELLSIASPSGRLSDAVASKFLFAYFSTDYLFLQSHNERPAKTNPVKIFRLPAKLNPWQPSY